MKCPNCGNEEKDDALFCSMCKQVFRKDYPTDSSGPKAEPLTAADEEYLRKMQHRQNLRENYLKKKLKAHSITGALTFAILAIFFGLPGSLHPLRLIIILILSAVFGLPLGYIISVNGGGAVRGALISAGVFTLLLLIMSIPIIIQGDVRLYQIILLIIQGAISGAIPGAIIGWHVDLDQT